MRIISRAEWGARPPKQTPQEMGGSFGVYVHHTTGASLGRGDHAEWVRAIQNYHMDSRDYNDIAYSFLVDASGNVFEGRGWGVVGAHTLGYNRSAHGLAYLGDGNDPVPPEALEAFGALEDEHSALYGSGYRMGHRDVASTNCCGDELYAAMRAGFPRPAPPTPAPSPEDDMTIIEAHVPLNIDGAGWAGLDLPDGCRPVSAAPNAGAPTEVGQPPIPRVAFGRYDGQWRVFVQGGAPAGAVDLVVGLVCGG